MNRLAVAVLLMVACDSTPTPTRLAIEPDAVTIWQDQVTELRAVVYDQNDEVYTDPVTITWATNNPTIGTVDDGIVSPEGDGEVRITATATEYMLNAHAVVAIRKVHFLRAAAAYITQANQHPLDPIPVLEGREGLLRIHIAEDLPYAPPAVRVQGVVDGAAVFDELLAQAHPEILRSVDQSSLDYSYNAHLPGDLIRSGLEFHLTYDPADDERAVAGEEVIEVDVVNLKPQRQMLVPVSSTRHPSDHAAGWVDAMTEDHRDMTKARYVLPIVDRTIRKHALYETDADLWTRYNGWVQLLREIAVLHQAEPHKDHYYYGAIRPPYFPGGGIYGIGFVGSPQSAGDTDGEVFAHEVGHNMRLAHAPCRVNGDPSFPDPRGYIQYWGWNPATGRLLDPARWTDVMGYCRNTWIHPYHFEKATRFRLSNLYVDRSVRKPMLMLWGSVHEGAAYLEPVLQITGQPTLPDPASPYLLEGYGPRGEVVFSHRVPMAEISHVDAQGFNVLLPVPTVPVASVTLSGPDGTATMAAESTSPLAMIVDAATGEVRAIRRNWQGIVPAGMRAIVTTGLPENR